MTSVWLTPVPIVTYRNEDTRARPAPNRPSASAAARTSDSTWTGATRRARLSSSRRASPSWRHWSISPSRGHELGNADPDCRRWRGCLSASSRDQTTVGEHRVTAAAAVARGISALQDSAVAHVDKGDGKLRPANVYPDDDRSLEIVGATPKMARAVVAREVSVLVTGTDREVTGVVRIEARTRSLLRRATHGRSARPSVT